MFRFRAKAWLGRVCGITPGQSLRNRSRISQLALLCQPRFQRCLCFVCCLQKLCAACSVKGGNWGVPFMDFRFSSSGNPNSRSEALKRSPAYRAGCACGWRSHRPRLAAGRRRDWRCGTERSAESLQRPDTSREACTFAPACMCTTPPSPPHCFH